MRVYFFQEGQCEKLIKVEYHKFEESNFCSGSVFVARHGGKGMEEDDGWIVTFVHNEETDVTQVSSHQISSAHHFSLIRPFSPKLILVL